MAPWPAFVFAGAAIGTLTGLFGVGGSSIATPLLAVLGVPGLLAIASPLPATIPAALGAAGPYVRGGEARPRAAAWTLVGALPAAVIGALASELVGGPILLVASGLVLIVVGQRVLRPIERSARSAGTIRRKNRLLLVAAAAGVGLFTGLLANGGGFLLVPMYLLIFGLRMREAAGTSLLVIAALAVPTLATHWALGHSTGPCRRLRPRRDPDERRERPVGAAGHRDAAPSRVRLVPHRLRHRLRLVPDPRIHGLIADPGHRHRGSRTGETGLAFDLRRLSGVPGAPFGRRHASKHLIHMGAAPLPGRTTAPPARNRSTHVVLRGV